MLQSGETPDHEPLLPFLHPPLTPPIIGEESEINIYRKDAKSAEYISLSVLRVSSE